MQWHCAEAARYQEKIDSSGCEIIKVTEYYTDAHDDL
jgi:hypothetical protein